MDDRVITLLMGVLDGGAHLAPQLGSIAAQSDRRWRLVASDDGSRDGSRALLRGFGRRHPVQILRGPGAGFGASYLHLLRHLPEDAGPVALADQDDIWVPGKLARARAALSNARQAPALYCARRWIWRPGWHRCPASPLPRRAPSFRNALIENLAYGHTIVLNPAGARLARVAAQRTKKIFAHDWWLYLLITGAGGRVLFDRGPPVLLYRQHAGNALGAGAGLAAQVRNKRGVLRGDFSDRLAGNLAAMERVADLLTPEARADLATFRQARERPLLPRLKALRALAPYRQRKLHSLGFWGAAGLGRI